MCHDTELYHHYTAFRYSVSNVLHVINVSYIAAEIFLGRGGGRGKRTFSLLQFGFSNKITLNSSITAVSEVVPSIFLKTFICPHFSFLKITVAVLPSKHEPLRIHGKNLTMIFT